MVLQNLPLARGQGGELRTHSQQPLLVSPSSDLVTLSPCRHPSLGGMLGVFTILLITNSLRVYAPSPTHTSHNGVRLFNCLSRHLRDLTGIAPDTFKTHLDKWLSTLPDEPPIPAWHPSCHQNTLTQVTSRLRKEEEQRPGGSGGPGTSTVP